MKRDLSKADWELDIPVEAYGDDGQLYYPTKDSKYWGSFGQAPKDPTIIEYNRPPADQPSLWLQWTAEKVDDKVVTLQWDGGEKFYEYTEWMRYIIENITSKLGGNANGKIYWYGEDHDDRGIIVVENNLVRESDEETEAEAENVIDVEIDNSIPLIEGGSE